MARRVGLVDLNTGEIIEEDHRLSSEKSKPYHPFGGRWFAMNQPALGLLKNHKRLDDHRVLYHLMETLEYDNYLLAPVKETAAALGMKPQNVSSCMRRLTEMKVVLEGKKIGCNKTYMLSPTLLWKGRTSRYPKKCVAGLDITSSIELILAAINERNEKQAQTA